MSVLTEFSTKTYEDYKHAAALKPEHFKPIIQLKFALSWEDSFMQDAANVVIYRKKVGESSYQRTVALKKGTTQYIDKTAAKGILYTYLISAENGNVVLAKSEEKNIQY